jgi:hypothetical protein
MKTDFHFKIISRVVVLAILVLVIFAMQRSVNTVAEDTPIGPTEIGGWAWSQVTGWVSLNCMADWDGDKVLENACVNSGPGDDVPYNLAIEDTNPDNPHITGCAWSGNTGPGGGTPLGWICFSDPPAAGTDALPDGVPTSSSYINALDNNIDNSYAAIIAFQGVAEDSYKIGFPISGDVAGTIDENNPINGCFNCFTEKTYLCEIGNGSCTACPGGEDSCYTDCPQQGDPLADDLCVVKIREDKCDNCLDYDYYDGRCEDGGGGGSHDSCQNDDDCTAETCEPAFWCPNAIGTIIDCTEDDSACDDPVDCVEHAIGELKNVKGGYACSDCDIADFDNRIAMSSYDFNPNNCNLCNAAFSTPGVMFDNQNGYIGSCEQLGDQIPICGGITPNCDLSVPTTTDPNFCHRAQLGGWAWNAWDNGEPVNPGLGWFQFSPRITTTSKPYFSVERGSIYSLGNIFSRYAPPYGRANASYLIESGGAITNFVSSSTLAGNYQGELDFRPGIDFLTLNVGTNEKYDNALGNIDLKGLTDIYRTEGGIDDYNKYNSKIETVEGNFFNASPLLGKVLHISGDFTPTVSTINSGNAGTNGSGIVVVEGDLILNNNISYDGDIVDFLVEIPSIVWIVKGDIIIDGDVDSLAGTFIALGDPAAADCPPYPVDYPDVPLPPSNSCGRIDTCTDDLDCNNKLIVYGNVLAKQFDMGRTWSNTSLRDASEIFQNDGRLQANPPAGLVDFSKVVPRFTDSPY